MTSRPLTPADLLEIEQLKMLKSRYMRALEDRRWDDWANLFADDAIAQFAPAPGQEKADVHHGRAALREFVSVALVGVYPVMRVSQPDIEIVDDSNARAEWSLTERLGFAEGPLRELTNYGVYHDTYRKHDGVWLITKLSITTIRQDLVQRDGSSSTTFAYTG